MPEGRPAVGRPVPGPADLDLSLDQLVEIVEHFARMGRGLPRQSSQAGPADRRPTAIPDGRARALDLGGSRLRAADVVWADGRARIVAGPVARDMPWVRGRALSRERFLDFQAETLEGLEGPADLPLGYCFSYPSRSTAQGDARLTGWTKGVAVPDVVGRRVGRLLCDHLSRRGRITCRGVRVVNDSVALLWAGLAGPPADFYLGLVVGTGANLAVFWPTDGPAGTEAAVNLEAGGFRPPHLNVWDERVDRESENPGAQRLEKAVSGLYLPRLLKAVCPQAPVSDDSRSLISLLAEDPAGAQPATVAAHFLLQRSARLVAALLAAMIGLRRDLGPVTSVRVVAEGGLFWSRAEGRFDYHGTVSQALTALLARLGLGAVNVSVIRPADATLVGSALAALTSTAPVHRRA